MFNKYYALPHFKVPKAEWQEWETHAEDVRALDAEAARDYELVLAIHLTNENCGVIDYDCHKGGDGLAKYEEHRERFPEFFNSTRVERTGSGGYHVYFNGVEGSLPENPYGQAGDVDLFNAGAVRWIVIPPSQWKWSQDDGLHRAEYVLEQDKPIQDLPKGLLAEFREVVPPESASSERVDWGEAHQYLQGWKPKYIKGVKPKGRTRQTYNPSHVVTTLCGCEGKTFYRREGEQWISLNRHSELFHYLSGYFKEYVDRDRIIKDRVLNEAFSLVKDFNAKWQCPKCEPKFSNDDQIRQDVIRFLQKTGVTNFPSLDIISDPVNMIEGSQFFAETPHSFNVVGFTEARKSVFIRSYVFEDWKRSVGGTVVWLSADEKASEVTQHSAVPIYAYSTHDKQGASEAVFENSRDLIEMVETALDITERKGADMSKPLVVLDPMTILEQLHLWELPSDRNAQSYLRVYMLQQLLERTFPHCYFIYVLHSTEGKKDSSEGAGFGSMGWQARARLWVKCVNTNDGALGTQSGYVLIGGNWVKQSKYDMDLSEYPKVDLKPFKSTRDPLARAIAELLRTGETKNVPGLRDRLMDSLGVATEIKQGIVTVKKPKEPVEKLSDKTFAENFTLTEEKHFDNEGDAA